VRPNGTGYTALHAGSDWEVRTIGVDGTGEKGLTRHEADDYDPAWQAVR
jgi:hypothetical protein